MEIEQAIEELKKRYPDGSPYKDLDDLIAANSDLAYELFRFRNRSMELFHCPAELYLVRNGLLQEKRMPLRSYSAEERLAVKLDRALRSLEELFPEHKVFALNSLDKDLSERLAAIAIEKKIPTVLSLLKENGFEVISGAEVRRIRGRVIYAPGEEPQVIRQKVLRMLARLEEYYPDHVIPRGLQNDHKSLSKSISGLYQWLGYADAKAMLAAYGYEYQISVGRPSDDCWKALSELKRRYASGPVESTLSGLFTANPDLTSLQWRLSDFTRKQFSLPLREYLIREGVLRSPQYDQDLLTKVKQENNGTIPMGQEPVTVRERMERLFAKLDGAYPNKELFRLDTDHETWGETATELSRLLGYPSRRDFLSAYGYSFKADYTQGRPRTMEYDAVIAELKRRYPNGPKFSSMAALFQENPDLSFFYESLRHNKRATEVLGMPLKEFLIKENILLAEKPAPQKRELSPEEMKAELEFLKKKYETPYQGGLTGLMRDNPQIEWQLLWDSVTETHHKSLATLLFEEGILQNDSMWSRSAYTANKKVHSLKKEVDMQNEQDEIEKLLFEIREKTHGRQYLTEDSLMEAAELKDFPLDRLSKLIRKRYSVRLFNFLWGTGFFAEGMYKVLVRNTRPDDTILQTSEKNRLDAIVAELKKRYHGRAPENSFSKLKEANPDLQLGSLTGPIKRIYGLKTSDFLVQTGILFGAMSLEALGLDYNLRWQLGNNGVHSVGDLVSLPPGKLFGFSEISKANLALLQSLINQAIVLREKKSEDLGFPKRILKELEGKDFTSPISLIDGGESAFGFRRQMVNEIRHYISRYMDRYYREFFGDLRLDELDISRRVMSTLRQRGIEYAYQAADGCIGLPGIGSVSAAEILKALNDYRDSLIQQELLEEDTPEEETENREEEILSAAEDPVKTAREIAEKKAEAQQKFDLFIRELTRRYPAGSEPEHLMIQLRRKNTDLPFDEAQEWCGLLFAKPLKTVLLGKGLLDEDSVRTEEKPEKESPAGRGSFLALRDTDGNQEDGAFHVVALPGKPSGRSSIASASPDPAAGRVSSGKLYSSEEIDAFVKQDTEEFFEYAGQHQTQFELSLIPAFLRKQHRKDVSEYLRITRSVSYAEYFVLHGVITGRSASYWREQMLRFLQERFLQCSGGMTVDSEASFTHDPIRQTCRISAPLYEGYGRVTDLQIAERYAGELAVQPCFREDSCACDAALTSRGQILGLLSETLYRNTGLGTYLFPVLCSGTSTIRGVRISGDENPNVIFELRFG